MIERSLPTTRDKQTCKNSWTNKSKSTRRCRSALTEGEKREYENEMKTKQIGDKTYP